MKNYLAVDAGGTKVLAILYDEDFRPVRVCRTGSLRSNSTPAELIQRNISELIDTLGLAGLHLDHVTGLVGSNLISQMQAAGATVESESRCGEMLAGLSASCIFGDGMLALSGTGATLFARYNNQSYGVGGYGAVVSDEGSGYWIARNAFGAAIKDFQGRGPKTLLTPMLAEYLDRPGKIREAIFRVYSNPTMSPIACVASCAPVVSKAAEEGDEVALSILREAATVLAEQLLFLVRNHDLPKNLPITISGSIWRSHHALMDKFSSVLRDAGMEQDVTIPTFQPIVGMIINHYYSLHGQFEEADRQHFMEMYKNYLFTL